jgi:phospholipid/cholesterol/gamma-HCH transport system substrate-binding protein
MRDEARNYMVVGAFVLAMLAGLILWIALVSGRTGATDSYTIHWADVTGLKEGAQILYQGYPVGLIDEITLLDDTHPTRFRVDVSVQRKLFIPDDSVAEIVQATLFSGVGVNIDAGESKTAFPPGSELPSIPLASVLEVIGSAVDSAKPILDKLAESMPEIIEDLATFTGELNVAMGQINALLSKENTGRVERILTNLEDATKRAEGVTAGLGETRKRVDSLIGKVDRIIEDSDEDITHAIQDLHESLEAVARHIDSISLNLEGMTRNMNEFSAQIRENPGVLIRGRSAGDEVGGDR